MLVSISLKATGAQLLLQSRREELSLPRSHAVDGDGFAAPERLALVRGERPVEAERVPAVARRVQVLRQVQEIERRQLTTRAERHGHAEPSHGSPAPDLDDIRSE